MHDTITRTILAGEGQTLTSTATIGTNAPGSTSPSSSMPASATTSATTVSATTTPEFHRCRGSAFWCNQEGLIIALLTFGIIIPAVAAFFWGRFYGKRKYGDPQISKAKKHQSEKHKKSKSKHKSESKKSKSKSKPTSKFSFRTLFGFSSPDDHTRGSHGSQRSPYDIEDGIYRNRDIERIERKMSVLSSSESSPRGGAMSGYGDRHHGSGVYGADGDIADGRPGDYSPGYGGGMDGFDPTEDQHPTRSPGGYSFSSE